MFESDVLVQMTLLSDFIRTVGTLKSFSTFISHVVRYVLLMAEFGTAIANEFLQFHIKKRHVI